ncbi:acyl-CoA dehydrogenase family protein [Streptomyces thermocarboxydus]
MTGAGVAEHAHRVAEVAARHAHEAEDRRRPHPEVVEALLSAGFARHFVPAEHGGRVGTFAELTRAVTTVGAACTATAWCASLAANLARMAAYLPAEGRAEVWANGPDALVVGSLSPFGNAERVDGGYRLSGRWPYISGVDFSSWALLCGTVPGSGGPVPTVFAVPAPRTPSWTPGTAWACGEPAATPSPSTVPSSQPPGRSSVPACW